jgi:hypothetical protein
MSQGNYIKDMLKKFDMNDSKAISTPMQVSSGQTTRPIFQVHSNISIFIKYAVMAM